MLPETSITEQIISYFNENEQSYEVGENITPPLGWMLSVILSDLFKYWMFGSVLIFINELRSLFEVLFNGEQSRCFVRYFFTTWENEVRACFENLVLTSGLNHSFRGGCFQKGCFLLGH